MTGADTQVRPDNKLPFECSIFNAMRSQILPEFLNHHRFVIGPVADVHFQKSPNGRVDQNLRGFGDMRSGIFRTEHARCHVCAVHEEEELVGENIGLLCACLLCQLTKFYTDRLFVFDSNLMTRIIRLWILG